MLLVPLFKLSITHRFGCCQIHEFNLKYMTILQGFGRSVFHSVGAIHEAAFLDLGFPPNKKTTRHCPYRVEAASQLAYKDLWVMHSTYERGFSAGRIRFRINAAIAPTVIPDSRIPCIAFGKPLIDSG